MSKRRPYQRQLETDWWLKSTFYIKYIIREGSSIFITLYSLILAWGVFRLSQGEAAFNGWVSALQHPISMLIHLLILVLALYHTLTWFSLAPKALDLWIKGRKISEKMIVTGHYIAFVIVCIFCLIIIV